MIEINDIKKIQKEYRELLSAYEHVISKGSLTTLSIKAFLSEIKIFWYRKQSIVSFILNHLEYDDDIAFLAGNIDINIQNDTHKLFTLVGKHRIINDPLLKLSCFYRSDYSLINYNKLSDMLCNAFGNIISILDDYSDDFWILPINTDDSTAQKERENVLKDVSKSIFLNFFTTEFKSIQDFLNSSLKYEDIYEILNPTIRDMLFVDSYRDFSLTIRERIAERCNSVLVFDKHTPEWSETEIFANIVIPQIHQYLDILATSSEYKIIPYIDSLSIMLFHSVLSPNFESILDAVITTKCAIAFIATEHCNFDSVPYDEFKEKVGNGKLINGVLEKLKASNKMFPNATPSDIANLIDEDLKSIDLPGSIQ